MLIQYIRQQVAEIATDPVLRQYGACLALLNGLTAIFWLVSEPISQILAPTEPPVCWPFFRDCHLFRHVAPSTITWVIVLLLALALLNTALFLINRLPVGSAYISLAVVTSLKCTLLFQDYRLIHNQHYMANWLIAVFLLVPQKRRSLLWLTVLFYFWAGLLKLNATWLSGSALYGLRPFGIPSALIPAACLYVVVLELVFSWGLLSKREGLIWFTFTQLVIFHISSFWVVGYFYPLLMFLILALVPLTLSGIERGGHRAMTRHVMGRVPATAPAIVVASFSVAQCAPFFYPGDSAVTGEGRMFALHMFDERVECRSVRILRTAANEERIRPLKPRFVHRRTACDPLVHFDLARSYCNGGRRGPMEDFDLKLESRVYGANEYREVINVDSFCAANLTYTMLGHNSWILPSATSARSMKE